MKLLDPQFLNTITASSSMTQKKPSKSEKRELLRQAKIEKNKKSNIRFADSFKPQDCRPRSQNPPDLNNIPRIGVDIFNYMNYAFEWNIFCADCEGEWSWKESRQWTDKEYSKIICANFNPQKGNTWKEVEEQTYDGAGRMRKKRNTYQDLSSICPEAQSRWMDLDETISQFVVLFRCRLGTYKRAWGFRVNNHYFLVWYERNHKICPITE